jgi:hypothetical protein
VSLELCAGRPFRERRWRLFLLKEEEQEEKKQTWYLIPAEVFTTRNTSTA